MVLEIFWLRDGFNRIIWSLIYFGFDLDSKKSLFALSFDLDFLADEIFVVVVAT